MNGMDFLTGPMAQAIGWALLHLLWQGAIVAGILAATLGLLSRQSANVRYAAACGALVLMLALGVATAWRAYEPLAAAAAPGSPVTIGWLAPADTPDTATPAAAAAPTWRERAATLTLQARTWLPQIVLAWLVGVALLSMRLLLTLRRAHQLAQRDTVSAGEEWQVAVRRLAEALQLRRGVKLLESAAVDVPTVIGWMRPVVLLPASTLVGLSPDQLEMILAHELAHIRRHDFFVNLLQAVVETLMFYHPAVWWMSRQVRIERENCCDDLAVAVCGNPIQYARALARLEELRMTPMQATLAANGGSLLDRVRRLVGAHTETTVSAPRWAAGLAVLTILLLVVAAPSLPALEKRDEPQAAKERAAGTRIDVAAEAGNTEEPEAIEVAELEVEDESDADDMDFNIDPDIDIDLHDVPAIPPYPPYPAVAPVPMVTPVPHVAPTPMVAPIPPVPARLAGKVASAVAPRAVAAALAGMDFEYDFEFEFGGEDDDKDKNKRSRDRKIGEDGLSVDDLISLRIHNVTPEYISKMRAIFPDLTLDEAVSMKIHGVSPDFVSEMRAASPGAPLNAREITSLKIHDVSPDYIRDMRSAGLGAVSLKEIQSLKIHGVSPSYINEMRGAGLGTLTIKDILSLKIHGVDASYLESMRNAGVKLEKAKDVVSIKIHDVTPAFVKQLANAGYTNMTARELARLAAAGVNSDFIRDMAKYRDKN